MRNLSTPLPPEWDEGIKFFLEHVVIMDVASYSNTQVPSILQTLPLRPELSLPHCIPMPSSTDLALRINQVRSSAARGSAQI